MYSFSPFWSRIAAATGSPPRIVFTDADDLRTQQAAQILEEKRLITPVFPHPLSDKDRKRFFELLTEKQKRFNLPASVIENQIEDTLYQGVAMLLDNRVDGLVGGSMRPTADLIRAALQCIGSRPGNRLVSGHFLIETDRGETAAHTPFLFADCAVVPEPSARSLAAIAVGAAASYHFFTNETPRVAMLSFSTRGSADHPLVDRIKEAVAIVQKLEPALMIDGEIQVDAALDSQVAIIKGAGDSPIAGQANVFIFPTLEAGNIGYKLVQRFSNARVAGPLLWGLDRPVSDLSRGCTTQEIVDTTLCVASMIRGVN